MAGAADGTKPAAKQCKRAQTKRSHPDTASRQAEQPARKVTRGFAATHNHTNADYLCMPCRTKGREKKLIAQEAAYARSVQLKGRKSAQQLPGNAEQSVYPPTAQPASTQNSCCSAGTPLSALDCPTFACRAVAPGIVRALDSASTQMAAARPCQAANAPPQGAALSAVHAARTHAAAPAAGSHPTVCMPDTPCTTAALAGGAAGVVISTPEPRAQPQLHALSGGRQDADGRQPSDDACEGITQLPRASGQHSSPTVATQRASSQLAPQTPSLAAPAEAAQPEPAEPALQMPSIAAAAGLQGAALLSSMPPTSAQPAAVASVTTEASAAAAAQFEQRAQEQLAAKNDLRSAGQATQPQLPSRPPSEQQTPAVQTGARKLTPPEDLQTQAYVQPGASAELPASAIQAQLSDVRSPDQ